MYFSISNWTPWRTGKENVFKCFFACRLGQLVRLKIDQSEESISHSTTVCAVNALTLTLFSAVQLIRATSYGYGTSSPILN